MGLAEEHVDFLLGSGDAHREAVELGFRQGVGAVELDRVLGGDDEEGGGKAVGGALDGGLPFAHGFE